MSTFSVVDEALLQSMVRQLLQCVKERLANAPSLECADEILLHLEETDEHFHNYELVKYLRHYIKSCMGSVIEEENEKCTFAQSRGEESGFDTLVQQVTRRTRESKEYAEMMHSFKNVMMAVVESLLNKFEEDQTTNREMPKKNLLEQHCSHYTDNCSDSDSSLNQSYTFMNQEQLQLIAEQLDPSQPEEIRREAMQTLCSAPPSDVLNCESWNVLHKNLILSLADPDSAFTDKILRFYAKTFSSSPLNMAREVYTSLAKHLELLFMSRESPKVTPLSGVDITSPDIVHLLKKIRLLNDYQKEAPSFWIRHPEKYMEEIVESTLSFLSVNQDSSFPSSSQSYLEPVFLLALIDTKAMWFKKWMHAHYSRTVVLRLLEKKYKTLIIAAIEQCFYYFESSQSGADETSKATMSPQQQSGTKQKTFYTRRELHYLYFVHSLSLLGRLLIYKHGRKLFPVKLKNRKDLVSLSDLVVLFTNIMLYCPNGPTRTAGAYTGSYSPSNLAMEVLKMLCDRKECASECLFTGIVIDSLLSPIQKLLKGKKVHQNCNEITFTYIADILARIASIEGGLSILLYGDTADNAKDPIVAAHMIAQFSKKLLNEDIPALSESDMLPVLKGSFIFVCRQMYHTCEGLQVLIPYQLHKCIADAWKQTILASERTSTPVAGAPSLSSGNLESQIIVWEESLLDNLLNFAATPKGLLLLQQTGAINECVAYMFSRFSKKLQVSRCEKFGYGVMVTQIAATAPGALALHQSGLIQALVTDLWSLLECGRDDIRVIHPKPIPVDPIDRSCQKSLLALVNLLSSYQAVYEIIGKHTLPSKDVYTLREVPTSFDDILDRLVIINSDAKINSLFNYEQSHTFGLRLLSVLCSNLDTQLLLESQYNVSETLLNAQKENCTETSTGLRNVIIDGLSVERNHLLIHMNVIGGPNERVLPPRVVHQSNDPYPWPMYSSHPVPKCYILEMPLKDDIKQDNEILKFLSARNEDTSINWLENCRKLFCKTVKSKPAALGATYGELLDKYICHLSETPSSCFFKNPEYKDAHVQNETLSAVQQLGVKMAVRYGRHLNLLSGSSEHELTQVLEHCKLFLKQQQLVPNTQLRYLQGSYPGHDWFASSVFLLMSGDSKKTVRFLLKFSNLLVSAYLWLPRLHISKHLPADIAESGIHPIYSCTAHYTEMLMKAEVPLVFSAFRMSGFTPSQICLHWLSQCFWNYLDWIEICHYIAVCIILGPDYQIYLCIAIFKHLHQEILQHTQTQDLQVFLKEEAIHGFHVGDYLEYMENLEQIYRPTLLKEMKNFALR